MENDQIQKGYWAIATQKHLKGFTTDSTNIDELDDLNIAGKAGRFLGAIRGNGKIENIKKLEKMANHVGITKSELHHTILPEIEKAADGKVEIIKNTSGDIIGIVEYLFDNLPVLEIAGEVFEQQNPSDIERIVISTMDETRKVPYLESELGEHLSKTGFQEEQITLSLALQEQFRLIQRLRISKRNDPIISNEYVWGANHAKIASAIGALDLGKKQSLRDVVNMIQSTQGLPLDDMPEIDSDILLLAQKTGMILPTRIISARGIEKDFVFSADIESKLEYQNDILDDVKLLLASIRFGQNYTNFSRISDPKKFLQALIDRDYVGPHSANATDYTLLEKRGIVKVETHTTYNSYTGTSRTGPCLRLQRKDVAKTALTLIANPVYTIKNDTEFGSVDAMLTASNFVSPEETRIKLGVSPRPVQEAEEYLSKVLRDELV